MSNDQNLVEGRRSGLQLAEPLTRRTFLKLAVGSMCSFAVGAEELEANPYSSVYLVRSGQGGWINLDTEDGYKWFCWLLRDIRAGGKIGLPPKMLGYILSWMQTFFRTHGVSAPIVVTSGLRVKASNKQTEGAARNSLHVPDGNGVFRAVDIKVPGVPGEYTGRLAALALSGGVGFYGDSGHTHIDVGQIRYWRHLPQM